MQVVTIFSTDTVATAVVVCALCSGAYIVFVKIIALVALFAETFKPVLADEVVVVMVAVFVGTKVA